MIQNLKQLLMLYFYYVSFHFTPFFIFEGLLKPVEKDYLYSYCDLTHLFIYH